MLKLVIPGRESFDSEKMAFITTKDTTIVLEHSLISVSKWEAIHKKCLLYCFSEEADEKLTAEEVLDYIRCMTITPNVDPNVYYAMTKENLKDVIDYINDPACATKVYHMGRNGVPKGRRKKDTAEVIYYYMITAGIPMECEKWHINRLLALIDVCATMGSGGKKMNQVETAAMYASMNKARRGKTGSSG